MCLTVDGEFSDDREHKELLDFQPCHPRACSAAECDGLEEPRSSRTIGSASCLAPRLYGRADDRLQDQASSGAVWIEFQSTDYLNAFQKLFALRHRKAEYQPSEGREKSIRVTGL
jgi:hypothetical protein